MDVYLRDEKKIINVELQNGHRLKLPKYSRFYQAIADIDNTPPSSLYSRMKDNYVIFICTFDPFLQGAREAKLETAKSMKSEKMTVSMIVHFTGLSEEEMKYLSFPFLFFNIWKLPFINLVLFNFFIFL